MTPTETPTLAQVGQLLAQHGYEVSESGEGVLRLRDMDSGVSLQAALEGNVLYMSLSLVTLPASAITPEIMRTMLAADSGIATSSFRLMPATDGKTTITLNSFCTLQNMGPEDEDDILSSASYLMVDLIAARTLLGGVAQ